jgi:outer membrane biosynthesis protein TonB
MSLVLLLLVSAGAAGMESFRDRLEQAHTQLRNGDIDAALQAYRDLQTDEPESELLYYSIGGARYERGKQEVAAGAFKDACASFQEAKDSLDKAVNASDPELRRQARFNSANCSAQIAMQSVAAQEYENTVKAFEECVKEYEDFLRLYPGHEGAKTNLDHMRYQLKKLLQNPPQKQPQQQGQDQQNDQQKQEQEQEQTGQSGQQKDSKQQQEKDQQQQQAADQQKQEKQEQENQEGQEQQQKEKQDQQSPDNPQQQQAQAAQDEAQTGEQKPEDRQNLEAILQSLEDMDNREVNDTINDRRFIEMGNDWW